MLKKKTGKQNGSQMKTAKTHFRFGPGQIICLALIDDANFRIQDEIYLQKGVKDTQSATYKVFDGCTTTEQLTTVFFVNRLKIVMVGIVTEYDNLRSAIERTIREVSMMGHFSMCCLTQYWMMMNEQSRFLRRFHSTPTSRLDVSACC